MIQRFLGGVGSVSGNSYSGVTMINGKIIKGSVGLRNIPEASSIRISAHDAKGKQLDDFMLPTTAPINVTILVCSGGRIDTIVNQAGDVTVHDAGEVVSISTTNGNIKMKGMRGDIESITTVNGGVHADMVGSIHNVSTVNGSISKTVKQDQAVSKHRDASPPRKKAANRPKYTKRPL
jgi:hypothetical protein